MIITIDGPSASGKSSAARALAHALGFYYLNTGLLFRGLAYVLLQQQNYTLEELHTVKSEDIHTVLARERFLYKDDTRGYEHIVFDGKDITPHLKTAHIDQAASIIGTNKKVRELIMCFEQEIAHAQDTVADGRDLGTTIFPDADGKFFLTASLSERARRWQQEQLRKGNELTLEECEAEIDRRDKRDAQRSASPMAIAGDACIIDNTKLSMRQTIDAMIECITKKKERN